jgi:hypothetical protein
MAMTPATTLVNVLVLPRVNKPEYIVEIQRSQETMTGLRP